VLDGNSQHVLQSGDDKLKLQMLTPRILRFFEAPAADQTNRSAMTHLREASIALPQG